MGRRQGRLPSPQLDSTACRARSSRRHCHRRPAPSGSSSRRRSSCTARASGRHSHSESARQLSVSPTPSSTALLGSRSCSLRGRCSSPARMPAQSPSCAHRPRPLRRDRSRDRVRRLPAALRLAPVDLSRDLSRRARLAGADRPGGTGGPRREPWFRRVGSTRHRAGARRLRARARIPGDARDHDLPHRSRPLLFDPRAQRPGPARRRPARAGRARPDLRSRRSRAVRRPGGPSRVEPPTEEEARCRRTFCFRA